MIRIRNEDGAAMLLALTLLLMLAAAGTAALLTARIETLLASSYRQSQEILAVAEGAIARAIQDLSPLSDWTAALSGSVSSFTDGASTGAKQLPGGDVVVLCCGTGSLTNELQLRGNGGGTWGANTPQWRLFGWGPVSRWLSGAASQSPFYVVVWVADDVGDGDGDPSVDANGIIVVHALALGPRGARRSIQASIEHARDADGRPLASGVSIVSSRESRW